MIDRDYRGNVGVVLFNLSKVDYEGTSLGKPGSWCISSHAGISRPPVLHYLQCCIYLFGKGVGIKLLHASVYGMSIFLPLQ